MRSTLLTSWGFLVVAFIILCTSSLKGADGEGKKEEKEAAPDKSSVLTVEESVKKLKAGILKIKEAEVLSLLGTPTKVKHPGTADFDLQMNWEYSTHIYSIFKEGKLVEVTGAFSKRLPVERITFDNFKRLRVGMSEEEVVELLGEAKGTTKKETTSTRSWGSMAQLQVSFSKDGRMVNYEVKENSAVIIPSDIEIPLLPKK